MAKSYEELTLADDFMFCKVMTQNPDLCRELTELITGRKVGEILKIDRQMPVEITADGRGVRFDIYMEDEGNAVYNIEMQTGGISDLPYRTRYYQAMIDLDQMDRGAKFQDLKRSYIIFICLENLFPQKGMHKYSFRSMCQEDPGLELGDDAVKIILSAKGDKDDVSEDLKDFLTYVAGGRPESGLTSRLDEQVRKARSHIEWRKEYMTLLERDERMREEGRKEGLEEGLKNGIEKGRQEERENTLRESARADAAKKEAARMQTETVRLQAETAQLRAELEALRRARIR